MRLDKLTTKFQEALGEAQTLALGKDHAYIEPAHVLAAMLRQRHVEAVEQLIWQGLEHFSLPVVVLGGLASATVPLLSPTCQALLQVARGNALDGGLLLTQQLIAASEPAHENH